MKWKFVKRMLPEPARVLIRRHRKRLKRATANAQKPLNLSDLRIIIMEDLGLQRGSTAFVHSAFGSLNVDFSPNDLLNLLLEIVGPSGNLLFPYYPGTAYESLEQDHRFNPLTTRSATGIVSDLARKHADAVVSYHPVKAVAAIGPLAKELTADHDSSPFPYDRNSPYCHILEVDGILIGLGVWTYNLSFVHTVDDTMKEQFPVCPYLPRLYNGFYENKAGNVLVIPTFAHDIKQVGYDTGRVPLYMKRYIDPKICAYIEIGGRRYFRGNCRILFAEMTAVAESGITIFPETAKITTREKEKHKWTNLLSM